MAIDLLARGIAASKADLVNGKIPSSELPSYVDDVLEYANSAAFPATGESGKIYVALDTNKTYRWSGSTYIEIGTGGGTANFNELTNRPKYNGSLMTGSTDIPEAKIFVATYGTTTASEVAAAITAGKAVFCRISLSGGICYLPLLSDEGIIYIFSNAMVSIEDTDISTVTGLSAKLDKDEDTWTILEKYVSVKNYSDLVDNTTTVNGHALSNNVLLDGDDINVDESAETKQTIKAAIATQSSQIEDLTDNFADEYNPVLPSYSAYDSTATYAVGAKVIYSGSAYVCKTAITTAEAFDSTKWTVIPIYAVGDFVTHDNTLYKCKTAVTTVETWTAAHWTTIDISSDVSYLKKNLISIVGGADTLYDDVLCTTTVGKYYYVSSDNIVRIATDASATAMLIDLDNFSDSIKLHIGASNYRSCNIAFTDSSMILVRSYIRSNTFITNKLDDNNDILLSQSDIASIGDDIKYIALTNLTSDYGTPQKMISVAFHINNGQISTNLIAESAITDSKLFRHESFFDGEFTTTETSFDVSADVPSLRLAIFTDTHFDPEDENNSRRTEYTLNNIRDFCRAEYVDSIIHLGDVVVASTQTSTAPNVKSKDVFKYVYSKLSKASNRLIFAIGNHDGDGGVPATSRNYGCMSAFTEDYVTRPDDFPYCYTDFQKQKIRCIVLSSLTYYASHSGNYWGIDDAQLVWLKQALLSLPSGYNVIICSHIGTYHIDWTTNKSETIAMVNAFQAHSGDFSSSTGRIICWFCGHDHMDWKVPTPSSGVNFPMITLCCSLYAKQSQSYIDAHPGSVAPARTDKTYTVDCWNAITYNISTGILKIHRFGGGSDTTIDTTAWDTSATEIAW